MENRSKQLANRLRNRMNNEDPMGLYAHMEFTFGRPNEWVKQRAKRYLLLLDQLAHSDRERQSQIRRVSLKAASTIAYIDDISKELKQKTIKALGG